REKYHVIAPDQRGHGDTGWTTEADASKDNSDLMFKDTEAFIEHLGFPQIVLCGMSMGGQNSIRYAARHPERLSRLIIVDIAPVTMQEGQIEMEAFRHETETMSKFEDFVERAIKFNPQRKPAHLKYSLMHSLKPAPAGWTWKQDHRAPASEPDKEQLKPVRQQRTDALWADVRAIMTPTLLMRGSISKILAPEAAAEVVKTMKDAELVVIEGAGHSVQGDQPAAFAQAAMAWLDRRG
ncbi:MAG: alpha/beta hydrolase, partial [Dehalococcoidia bacterium]|nr:alpha/beta hydrolase [Dehalococcoidia bacterium]